MRESLHKRRADQLVLSDDSMRVRSVSLAHAAKRTLNLFVKPRYSESICPGATLDIDNPFTDRTTFAAVSEQPLSAAAAAVVFVILSLVLVLVKVTSGARTYTCEQKESTTSEPNGLVMLTVIE